MIVGETTKVTHFCVRDWPAWPEYDHMCLPPTNFKGFLNAVGLIRVFAASDWLRELPVPALAAPLTAMPAQARALFRS